MKKYQQLLMMYVEGILKSRSTTTRSMEESASKGKSVKSSFEQGSMSMNDRSKFKKVEMLTSSDIDPDSWLFRMDQLSKTRKMIVAVISFDGEVLD